MPIDKKNKLNSKMALKILILNEFVYFLNSTLVKSF